VRNTKAQEKIKSCEKVGRSSDVVLTAAALRAIAFEVQTL